MFRDRRPFARPRPSFGLALVLALASGCGPLAQLQSGNGPGSSPPNATRAAATAAPVLPNQGSLAGTVLGPTDAIISNNLPGIIGNNGSGLISQTKFYSTAETGTDTQAIAGAQVVALDSTGKALCAPVNTDANGRYTLTGIGPSGPVIFLRASYTQDGFSLVLSRVVAAPREGSATAELDPASSLVAKKLTALLTAGAFPADAIDPAAAAQLADALSPAVVGSRAAIAVGASLNQVSDAFNQAVEEDPTTSQLISNVAAGASLIATPAPSTPPGGGTPSSTPSTTASAGGTPMPGASHAPSATPSPGASSAPSATPLPTPTSTSTSPTPPYLTTLAGSGAAALTDGQGTAAAFNHPAAVVADSGGNVYVADPFNHAIRKIDGNGNVTTLVSNPNFFPWGLAIGPYGVLFVADTNNDVIRTVTQTGQMSVYAGAVGVAGAANGALTNARFNLPEGLVFDANYNLYVCDIGDDRIRKIDTSSTVSTIAGSSKGFADGTGTAAQFYSPRAMCLDAGGNLIVADRYNHRIRRVTPAGVVTTIAGNGTPGHTDGPALQASFDEPQGVVLEPNGDLLIADSQNNCIRVLSPSGQVSTLIGTSAGYADGGAGVGLLNNPLSLALDAFGIVVVADAANNRLRLLVPHS